MTQRRLQRDATRIGLLYSSVSGIIGSGWLLGPFLAMQQAGPWSIASWVIGATAVLLLAFVFAELAILVPKSGALVHLSHLSHGELVGRIWSWILFLAYVTVPPVEVIAVLSYANNYIPGLVAGPQHLLTDWGYASAIGLLALIVTMNFLAIRWVLFINSTATWWKIGIALATIAILLTLHFHPANLMLSPGTIPRDGLFTSVATAGIIFSFLGFRQAIDLAGETRDPRRNIPFAVVGSVLISTLIYVGIQYAVIGSVDPALILRDGWAGLQFKGAAGPLAAIVAAAGAIWWSYFIYLNAIVAPLGTGFIYTTTTSRILMATGEMGSGPSYLTLISRQGVPWSALLATFVIGAIFLFPFPSWQKLVAVISSSTVLSYGIGPIVLLQLRSRLPDLERRYRIRYAWIVAPVAFIVANWIIFWTGFKTANYVYGILCGMFILYIGHYLFQKHVRACRVPHLHARHALWLIPYFGGMWALSWLGPRSLGGTNLMDFWTGTLLTAIWSVIVLVLALWNGLDAHQTQKTLNIISADLTPPIEPELEVSP